jgi:adenosine kinase
MKILLTGSIAYDYLMVFPGYFRDHILPERIQSISLSFLVESMQRQRGGVAPNIAYSLALLGGRPRIWAAVGEDFEEYRAILEKANVDTSGIHIIPGETTASFFVTTDRANAQLASFYPGAMGYSARLSLNELKEDLPDLVMISPNDPAAMLLYVKECQQMGIPYIYDPSQQTVRLSAAELSEGIQGARALMVNDYEFALIQKATGLEVGDFVHGGPERFIVVTCGENGSLIYTPAGLLEIPVVPVAAIADPTGVGDAFRGGFLAGYSRGFDLQTCGQMGSLAAAYCLEQCGPQAHYYTIEQFIQRFRTIFNDQGRLDAL